MGVSAYVPRFKLPISTFYFNPVDTYDYHPAKGTEINTDYAEQH